MYRWSKNREVTIKKLALNELLHNLFKGNENNPKWRILDAGRENKLVSKYVIRKNMVLTYFKR